MYDFLILTTAITRPDLHQRILPATLQFIDGLAVKWLINVDDIDNEASIAATVENFSTLFAGADNIDAEFLYAEGKSCFFSAARRLARHAHELLPQCRTGVLWLEDDWELTPRAALARWLNQYRVKYRKGKFGKTLLPCPGSLRAKQAIIEARCDNQAAWWYVSLVPKAKVSFNPGIWSKALFDKGIYQPLTCIENGRLNDPENHCFDPQNEAEQYQRTSVFVDPPFQDVGQRWLSLRDLKKWQKDSAELTTRGRATYSKSIKASAATQHALTGCYLLPDFAFNSPLTWLVATAYHNGRLTARLPGVPWLSFELIVADDLHADIYLNRMHGWSEKSGFMRTTATLRWQCDPASGRPSNVAIRSKLGNVTASYRRRWPLSALWIVPMQSLAGLGLYLFTLYKLMQGLKY